MKAFTIDYDYMQQLDITFLCNSSDNQLDNVSSVFDDGDSVRVEHALCRVPVDL